MGITVSLGVCEIVCVMGMVMWFACWCLWSEVWDIVHLTQILLCSWALGLSHWIQLLEVFTLLELVSLVKVFLDCFN
jgi:hypothetical protein